TFIFVGLKGHHKEHLWLKREIEVSVFRYKLTLQQLAVYKIIRLGKWDAISNITGTIKIQTAPVRASFSGLLILYKIVDENGIFDYILRLVDYNI
ncbi:hypothetical protein ACJX0J_031651, partial [Zea mays]